MTFSFGPFRADQTAFRVLDGDRTVPLTPKLLDLLFYLLERPGVLVTKEELLDGVWPDANVTDNALAQAVSELREALGDAPATPAYIKTVARRGYRFVGEVTTSEPHHTDKATGASAPPAIAVLDFTNLTGDADVDWLTAGIAETVSSDLAALEAFRVVDRHRVTQTTRSAGASLHDIGRALDVPLIATGSFQRSGDRLRIAARIVNLEAGEAVADAKVDGLVADVFALQDAVVTTLARELGVSRPGHARATRGRETSSLDAFRAYTEGWLKLESLDTSLVEPAIADFQRAILADTGFTMAYTGLANAELVAFEQSRLDESPNDRLLESGIGHAEHAIQLEPELAEAHATLSFLLASARRLEPAQAAGRRAVALEPDNWRHQYRLGHATWGAERVRALERSLLLYPQFPFARLEVAMVHVARGQLDQAESLARSGADDQDRRVRAGDRFPGLGFHWLLGALLAAGGHREEAASEFEQELAFVNDRRLYGREYASAALLGLGFVQRARGQLQEARESFGRVQQHLPGHARAFIAEAAVLERLGATAEASETRRRARQAVKHLENTRRAHEAQFAAACEAAMFDSPVEVVSRLEPLFREPPSVAGWTIPIEPSFRQHLDSPEFTRLLATLAERAS